MVEEIVWVLDGIFFVIEFVVIWLFLLGSEVLFKWFLDWFIVFWSMVKCVEICYFIFWDVIDWFW